jgi:hypothetical protein
MKPRRLPKSLEKYFWDCNIGELNWNEHNRFIVERILLKELKEIIQTSRRLDPKTVNYWSIMFDGI